MKTYRFKITVPSEYSAGIRGFTDIVSISIQSRDPGGEKGEFESFMRDALSRWYEGGSVTVHKERLMGATERFLTESWTGGMRKMTRK